MSWVWAYRVNFFGGLGGLSCLSFFPTLAVYLSAGRSAEAGGREGREGKEEKKERVASGVSFWFVWERGWGERRYLA